MNQQVIRFFTLLTLFIFISCSEDKANASEQVQEKYQEGVHFEILKTPSAVRDSSKIEVVEVFWFGCNHCYALESYLTRWKRDLPADVDFWKSHATWNEILKIHARMFYTARALGIDKQLVPAAFNTIQTEGRRLTGNSELEYYFKGFGVERDKYKSVASSFGVKNALKQADQRMKQWNISGVPTLIVNGKYKVAASRNVGTDGLLDVVDFLIEKERMYLTK
jgi:thiol:disulfide interchange protein DsbA